MNDNLVTIDFNGLQRGDVVDTQFDGVTIIAQRAEEGGLQSTSQNDALIFDGADVSGGDNDLSAPDQEEFVIVAERDGEEDDPDDNADGGVISFTFDDPADVQALTIIDGDAGGLFLFYDENGDLIETFDENGDPNLGVDGNGDPLVAHNGQPFVDGNGDPLPAMTFPPGPDGAVRSFDLGVEGVAQFVVVFIQSGGVDDLSYIPFQPEPASVGGTVFMDNNDDSVEDSGDMTIDGVVVTLLQDGVEIAQTVTDENGSYLFDDLEAGTGFSVQFAAVGDKVFVDANAGSDNTIDSDVTVNDEGAISPTFDLTAGEHRRNVDAGVEDPGTASLGNFVFLDENGNGVFDAKDSVVEGVTVELLADDGSVLDETVTAANGSYLFADLTAGMYMVRFTAPSGLAFTTTSAVAADTTNNDSDADQVTGVTDPVDISIGEAERNVDAGLVALPPVDTGDAALAGRVFMDNNDDDQDNDEMGVAGVTVALTNAAGTVLGTTQTAADGSYEFTGLAAGDYRVTFPTEVADKILVGQNVGDDATDSDADQATGMTGVISLDIGERSENNDAGLEQDGTVVPAAANDSGVVCADHLLTVDVLANDSGISGLTITAVDGQSISEGQTINVDGIDVSLIGGQLVFDGESAFEDLTFGEHGHAEILYTITDEAGLEATAMIDLEFKGVAETIAELHATLPTTGTYQILGGDLEGVIEDDAYTVILNGTGDARFDGVVFEQAYCISVYDPVVYAQLAADAPSFIASISGGDNADVFNADQISAANGQTAAENLDLINWIINQDFSNDGSGQYSDWEVQRAIWELTDNIDTVELDSIDAGYGQDADVNHIVALAMENGEGFVAGEGDIATMIIDPGSANEDNTQPFIVAFDFDENNCDCPSDRAETLGPSAVDHSDHANDPILGTDADDVLKGASGIDRMAGGEGNDVFVFAQGTDLDIVYDYVDGTDQLSLDGMAFADLEISAYRGTDTLIEAGEDRMILRDVDHTEIDVSDFAAFELL